MDNPYRSAEFLANRRRHIAYHEAGHAVIALILGYKVGKVTIKPRYSQLTLGRTEGIQPGEASSNRVVDREATDIKIDLAGPLAEQLINPAPFDELIENGSGGDWRSARRTARSFGLNTPREAEILIVRYALESAVLVQQHQEAITRVAAALLEHETLVGDEIKRIADGRLQ
jgi:ATP-dependent Zn protease